MWRRALIVALSLAVNTDAFTAVPYAHQPRQQQQQQQQQQQLQHDHHPQQRHHLSTSSTLLYEQVLEGRRIGGAIKPVNNFILVKTVGIQDKTDDGILLAGSSKVVKTRGEIIAVGPGKTHPETGYRTEIPLVAGKNVLYGQYDGTEIDLDGAPHMLIRDDNVLISYEGEKIEEETVNVLYDKILIKVNTKEQETAGGLLLAASKDGPNRPSTGTVVKVGPGSTNGDGDLLPMLVKEGDEVKFRDYAGNEVEIGGNDYSVVSMGDILAKF